MLEHDFHSQIGYWVHVSAHRFERTMNAELAGEGITYRQCQVLAWLALDGVLAQCELAERMNVEPPTLVKVLDRMERDGLIVREGCPDDRRRKVVRPTAKAVPVWRRIIACADRVEARSAAGLTAADRETFLRMLKTVHDNLGGPPGEPAGDGACPDRPAPRESPGGTRRGGRRRTPGTTNRGEGTESR